MFGVPHNMSSSMVSITSYKQRDINNTGQVLIEQLASTFCYCSRDLISHHIFTYNTCTDNMAALPGHNFFLLVDRACACVNQTR